MFGHEYLLDTNALVYLARNRNVGVQLAAELAVAPTAPIFISAITLGEVAFLARRTGWSQNTVSAMADRLRQAIIVEVHRPEVVEAYAAIQYRVRVATKPAIPNRDNDIWIAASARAAGLVLVTGEKWFDNVAGGLVSVHRYDTSTGKTVYVKLATE